MIAPTTQTGSGTIRPNSPAVGLAGSSNANVSDRSANALTVLCAPGRRSGRCRVGRRTDAARSDRCTRSAWPAPRRWLAGTRHVRYESAAASVTVEGRPCGLDHPGYVGGLGFRHAVEKLLGPRVVHLIVASDDGCTHYPPMKKRSARWIGALILSPSLVLVPSDGRLSHCNYQSRSSRQGSQGYRAAGTCAVRQSWATGRSVVTKCRMTPPIPRQECRAGRPESLSQCSGEPTGQPFVNRAI